MVLDVQHGSGPVYEVMNASLVRGGLGEISNRPIPAGWVTSTGSLSGGSTFLFDMPIVWGQPWDVTVGLLAWSDGTADTRLPQHGAPYRSGTVRCQRRADVVLLRGRRRR